MSRQKNKQKWRGGTMFSSLQAKYAMSYLVVFAVILILLNTYPVMASQQLLVSSKGDAMKSQATVMASALMELESLSGEQVGRVMTMLDAGDTDRTLVTDSTGMILYDSTLQKEEGQEERVVRGDSSHQYALFQELVTAMRGSDVVCTRYEDGMFRSVAAVPVVYRGMVIGCVCVEDMDADQGVLLQNLQKNLRNISIVVLVVALFISGFFSQMMTSRIAALLSAIRIVGEGEYGHRLQVVGRDEMDQLAEEFNQLTDRLQTTEEVRRRFVADASHELKTPLAAIRLLSDSILESEQMEPELVREFVTDIDTEAQRLTRITEHLLTLTKLDSLPAAQREAVDVCRVAQRVLAGLQPVADAAGVTVWGSWTEHAIIPCTGDELYQIVYNLVENAIKYNVTGGKVELRVTARDDQVVLEVRDTGMGIPEADRPKVFNRFYRVDKARSRAAGGTGLGLSIVRDTVRRHGGWVTVEPNSPRGCVFTVGFPCWEEDEPV